MKKIFLILIILIFSFQYAAGADAKKTVTIAFGMKIPPYIFEEGGGIEYDIIVKSLETKGYKVKAEFQPFARVPVSLKNKSVDAAARVNESFNLEGVYLSDSYITFQNVAIAFTEKKLKIETISDLTNKKVVAFQNANVVLGKAFGDMTKANSNYFEHATQEAQVAMLYKDRADVLIMEINIFKYFKLNSPLIKESEIRPETIYMLFPATLYKVAFSNKAVCDDFNDGLKKIKQSGVYDSIFNKYLIKK